MGLGTYTLAMGIALSCSMRRSAGTSRRMRARTFFFTDWMLDLIYLHRHLTGRGGQANISNLHEPPVEHHDHPHPHFESTGRGGAGNIVSDRARSKSKSRE